jgi:hypothetical protein
LIAHSGSLSMMTILKQLVFSIAVAITAVTAAEYAM